jgi:2-dehydrotetronate isomerase
MPQFAANLSLMYPEFEMIERMNAAQADGFAAVECLFPYAYEARDWARALQTRELVQVLFNAPPGGFEPQDVPGAWEQGQRGSACLPGREREFEAGVHMALAYAQQIGCRQIHVMAGCVPPEYWFLDGPKGHWGADHSGPMLESKELDRHCVAQRLKPQTHHLYASVDSVLLQTYLANLERAATWAQDVGIDVLIEPINARDMPHYFLNLPSQAQAIVQTLSRPNLKVQLDLYHAQITQGDLLKTLAHDLPNQHVAHLQIAGVPMRHEPDTGEVQYGEIFALLDQLSERGEWQGWVGCEYRPREGLTPGGTHRGLAWMAPYRDQQRRALGG